MKKIVKIEYLDHVESRKGDPKLTKPVHCIIYGEILKETKVYITVLAYYEKRLHIFDSEEYELENFAMTIVKSTIIERKELVVKG